MNVILKGFESLSMRKFCEQQGLRRQDVIDWCRSQGIATDKGVDESLARQVVDHFKGSVECSQLAVVEHNVGALGVPVEVLGADDDAFLDSALQRFEPKPVAFVQLDDQTLQTQENLKTLLQVVDTTVAQVEQRKALIQKRYDSLQKQKKLVALAQQKLGDAAKTNQKLNDATARIQKEEQELADVLSGLGLNGVDLAGV